MQNELEELLKSCKKLGEPVAGYGQAMAVAFKAQREMIAKALKMQRASPAEMIKLLAPTEEALTKLETLKASGCEKQREFSNHLQMLCGACSALGWVTTADPKGYGRRTFRRRQPWSTSARQHKLFRLGRNRARGRRARDQG